MENFWPTDLFEDSIPKMDQIQEILVTQVDAIQRLSIGLVTGLVETTLFGKVQSWSFSLYPAGQPAKKLDLFVVREMEKSFPIAVESFVSDSNESKSCNSHQELRRVLKNIFSSQRVRKVVRQLAQSAEDAGVKVAAPSDRYAEPETLPISIGNLIRAEGRQTSYLTISNLSGLLSVEDIRSLLMQPDEKNSPIQTLNNRYVIALRFQDVVKINISKTEMNILQAEVRKALNQAYLGSLSEKFTKPAQETPPQGKANSDLLSQTVNALCEFCSVYISPVSASVANKEKQFLRAFSEFASELMSEEFFNWERIELEPDNGFDLLIANENQEIVVEIKQNFNEKASPAIIDRVEKLMIRNRYSNGVLLFLPRHPQQLNFERRKSESTNAQIALLWPREN